MLVRYASFVVVIGAMVVTPARAAPIATVDQSQLVSTAAFPANSGQSVAQSFVPTLTGLDAVELRLGTFFNIVTPLSVNIREDVFSGPIIATSLPTVVSGDSATIAHFDFASTVGLTPGELYFIEFISPGLVVVGSEANAYASGALFVNGVQNNPNRDAFFVEGLHASRATVPEPPNALLVMTAVIGLVAIAGRRSRTLRGAA